MTSISTANAFTYRSSVSNESAIRASALFQAGSPQQASASSPLSTGGNLPSGSIVPAEKESSLRQALDAGYKALGKAPSGAVTGAEWDKVVGFDNFSRQDLFDMTQNASGEFSELEMVVAKAVLADRHAATSRAASPDGSDHAAIFRASVTYLDEAGSDEMKTLDWAKNRASAQVGYEWIMQGKGLNPETLDSGNAIVELFRNGYNEHRRYGKADRDVSDMPSYKEAIDLWNARQQTSAAYFLDLSQSR